MSIQQIAEFTYNEFSSKLGSDQIATRQALRSIGRVTLSFKSLDILEIGAGIGTITFFLFKLDGSKINTYIALERNDWCRKEFIKNIKSNKVVLLDSLESKLLKNPNFVIVDDVTTSEEIIQIINAVLQGVIIVEGHRFKQRLQILKAIQSKGKKYKYLHVGKSRDSYKGVGIFHLDSSLNLNRLKYVSDLIRIRSHISFMAYRSFRAKVSLRKTIFMVQRRR